ncbi:MAG TPA: hypothetical protein VIH61_02420, partial [Waddliaceae bacterium]
MGKEIKVSTPISVEATRSELYEFSPLGKGPGSLVGKAKNLLFLNRDKKEVWKTAEQRDAIFKAIYVEQKDRLKSRSVIEVHGVRPTGEYEYSYRENGKCVRGVVTQADIQRTTQGKRQPVIGSINRHLGPQYYKVQEISLRQFKQIKIANALVECVKALIELLATPFAYLYQLVAGSGEPRNFAQMLVPVQQDRTGEITHDVVLSQLSFMSRLFASEDPTDHTINLGLEDGPEGRITLAGETRPCKEESATHYKVWIDGDTRIKNIHYNKPDVRVGFYPDKDTREEVWSEFARPVWVPIDNTIRTKEGPPIPNPLLEQYNITHKSDGSRRARQPHQVFWAGHAHVDHTKTGVAFYGEWVSLPKDYFHSTEVYTMSSRLCTDAEQKPLLFSGAQQVSTIFGEAYQVGKGMHGALNSGNKKRIEVEIQRLARKFTNLEGNKHLIVPIGQGEGREYLPHFLVFVRKG